MTTAVSVPVSSPHSGAASRAGVGAIRTVISPASPPARYGSDKHEEAEPGRERGRRAHRQRGQHGEGRDRAERRPRRRYRGADAESEPGAEHVGDRPHDRVRQVAQAGEQQQRPSRPPGVERGRPRPCTRSGGSAGTPRPSTAPNAVEHRQRREHPKDHRSRPRRHSAGQPAPRREPARRADAPASSAIRNPAITACQSDGAARGSAGHRDRTGEQRVGQRDRQRGRADLEQAGHVTLSASATARPARSARRAAARGRAGAGRSGRRRGPSPRRGARRATAGQPSAARRPGRAEADCGAVIQPNAVSVTSTASPPAAAAMAANSAGHRHGTAGQQCPGLFRLRLRGLPGAPVCSAQGARAGIALPRRR